MFGWFEIVCVFIMLESQKACFKPMSPLVKCLFDAQDFFH